MPNPANYFPPTNPGRGEWWQNILDVGSPILNALNVPPTQVASILADAAWGVYLYKTLRESYDDAFKAIIGYSDAITDGPIGGPIPPPPAPATWPTMPPAVAAGLEKRREAWVQQVKSLPGYVAAVQGVQLKIEATVTPFDPDTYQAVIFGFSSPGSKTLSGKFRKAYGNIDGIKVRGRKSGTAPWVDFGMFTATPFTVLIPLAGTEPEEWEFQARAMKRDLEIGLPSTIVTQIIRG